MEVDESALTGESLPVAKRERAVDASAPLGERASVVHGGTIVTAGSAAAVVFATGERTELGRVSAMLRATTRVWRLR